ncbi:MAG: copper amine oxidase N-terminal domain-containing protein [Oscillospiraceae bacterium]|nr:copper amine oxidase N-terminal domain-containing protein [Oscillospiraceae bacterium]
MKNLKTLLAGIVIGAMLTTTVAFAKNIIWKELSAEFCDIEILIEGERKIPKDVTGKVVEPFIIDGTTYVPIRAISQFFGKQVDWDGAGKRVLINQPVGSFEEVIAALGEDAQYGNFDLDGDGIKELIVIEPDNDPQYVPGTVFKTTVYAKSDGIIKTYYLPKNAFGYEGKLYSNGVVDASQGGLPSGGSVGHYYKFDSARGFYEVAYHSYAGNRPGMPEDILNQYRVDGVKATAAEYNAKVATLNLNSAQLIKDLI